MMTLAASTAALAQEVYSADQIRQLAVEHNIRMRTANNAYLQAKEQQREAFTNYFPQVSATGIGFRSNKDMLKAKIHTSDLLSPQTMQVLSSVLPTEALGQIPPAFGMGMLDKGILGSVTAVQPVFAGGQIVNGNKLAKVGVEVSRLQQLTSRNEVVLTAEKYYWQIVTLKEKRRTLDAVSNMLAALEKDAEAAVKAGVAMRNDLLQVQLKQNEIENTRIKLDNALRLSKMVLAQYIGKDGQNIDVSGCADPQQMPDYPAGLKADPEQAIATTPEYRLLQKNVEAKDLQRRMELGKRLPAVGVGAGYTYTDMLRSRNNFGMVFATVSIPISDWWGGSHAVRRRQIAARNAREQLEDNMQLLKINMLKNWNDVDDAYKQLALAKKGIEQSEENLRLNRDFYHAGTVKMSDLLDAQRLFQQTRDQYVDAFAQLQIKMLEYRQSIGQ